MHPLLSTLTLAEAQGNVWDIVVVGAGPAGSMAARSLAEQGHQVLLVDRSTFPRSKVCGCCMNQAALGLLDETERAFLEAQGVRLQHYQLASGGRMARVPLHGGIAISRDRLDSHLVQAAISGGAEFLDATQCSLDDANARSQLSVQRLSEHGAIRFKAAVMATGLAGVRSTHVDEKPSRRSARSYIGAGAILEDSRSLFETGVVSMACHPSGYVGIVQLEDGRLDLAAAFDVEFVKKAGGLGKAAHLAITQSGLTPPPDVASGPWQGTVKLTHRRNQLFGDNYLVAGDAAGYVEPFTGEGIAWAMASGKAVASFAARALTEEVSLVGPEWSRAHARLLEPRMRSCRVVSFLLRQPTLVRWGVRALQVRPQLARYVERSLHRPFPSTLS